MRYTLYEDPFTHVLAFLALPRQSGDGEVPTVAADQWFGSREHPADTEAAWSPTQDGWRKDTFDCQQCAAPEVTRITPGTNAARDIVLRHGGSIEARSEGVRQGNEFVIRLPLAGPPD